LDDEEWDISYWAIWRSNRDLKYAGWRSAYQLYVTLPSECSQLVSVFYDFVNAIARVNKKSLKKFSYKFGDYLSDRAKTCPADKWGECVDQCFMIGHNKAVKCGRKMLLRKVVKYLKIAIRVLLLNKVQKHLLDAISDALKPVQDLIIAPMNSLINLEAMVEDVISGTLDNVLQDLIGALHPALQKRIELDTNPTATQGKTEM